jgi:hypothetical protein
MNASVAAEARLPMRVIRIDPKNSGAFNWRGQCYGALEVPGKAIADRAGDTSQPAPPAAAPAYEAALHLAETFGLAGNRELVE